jgi:predicted small secreted protein
MLIITAILTSSVVISGAAEKRGNANRGRGRDIDRAGESVEEDCELSGSGQVDESAGAAESDMPTAGTDSRAARDEWHARM